jgi:HPt (histidine-containing phosphotransfer) domain-containing protein
MTEIFNRQDLLERLEGDEEILEVLVQTFLEYTPEQIQGIRHALDAGDAREVQQQAHSLKGAAASISAGALRDAALQVELAGKNGALEQVRSLVETLIWEFENLKKALAG